MPPALDEQKVQRLTELASSIDCGDPEQMASQVDAFNLEASTSLEFYEFQGIYGGQGHETWVRTLLGNRYVCSVPDVTRPELVELARRVMECDGEEHAINFWMEMLSINTSNERMCELIFWPNVYFGDEGLSRELTPDQVVEIALSTGAVGGCGA